jgi:hypothetical protein
MKNSTPPAASRVITGARHALQARRTGRGPSMRAGLA